MRLSFSESNTVDKDTAGHVLRPGLTRNMKMTSEPTNTSHTKAPLGWVFAAGAGLGLFLGVLVGVLVGRPVVLPAPAPQSAQSDPLHSAQIDNPAQGEAQPPKTPSPDERPTPSRNALYSPGEKPEGEGGASGAPLGQNATPPEDDASPWAATGKGSEEPPPATLPKESIQAAIQAVKPAIAACYEEGLKLNPNMAGRIKASFTIVAKDGQGKLDEGEIEESELGNPFVDACILGEIARAEFPVPEGDGVVRVTYPFSFSSEE